MREKLQKEMKVESRKQKKNQKTKIKHLANSQVTNHFGKMIIKN